MSVVSCNTILSSILITISPAFLSAVYLVRFETFHYFLPLLLVIQTNYIYDIRFLKLLFEVTQYEDYNLDRR